MSDWLTAEQVEHIQWAVQRNRPVGGFVGGLRHATLPGLLEYGCLRAQLGHDAIPPLPTSILSSPLVESLDGVPLPRVQGTMRHCGHLDSSEIAHSGRSFPPRSAVLTRRDH